MRIGEVLSLNRTSIDFERKEARVIGKGNKERTVFFTDRALHWLGRYLEMRTDDAAALFLLADGTAAQCATCWPITIWTLLELAPLLTNAAFRAGCLNRVQNTEVVSYFPYSF